MLGVVGAAYSALQIGVPLNRHITIHWGLAGFSDAQSGAATSRLLGLMSDWVRKRGWKFAYIYVRENDPDAGKGSHVHILAHVPPHDSKAFTHHQRAWLRRVTGQPYRVGTIRSRPIGPTVRTFANSPDVYLANLDVAIGYLIKSALPDVAETLNLGRRERGGMVMGKRAGWSQCIGRSNRT